MVTAQVLDVLRPRALLLVLGNFGPLLAGTAVVLDILQAALQVRVLITSRERLNVQPEYVLRLDGLPRLPVDDGLDADSYSSV